MLTLTFKEKGFAAEVTGDGSYYDEEAEEEQLLQS